MLATVCFSSGVDCGEPRFAHGYIVGHAFTYGAVVAYQCDTGYELQAGAPTRGSCQANKQWEPPPQNCTGQIYILNSSCFSLMFIE